MELNDTKNVDDECEAEEEAPGKHAEDLKCAPVVLVRWIILLWWLQRGHKADGDTAW